MSIVVAHNVAAMNTNRQLNMTGRSLRKTTEVLSSGFSINRAADDAAGLAISEKMRRQIRGLNRGTENIQDGVSLVQVADGALDEVTGMIHRITKLAIQAANGTNSDSDRKAINDEIEQLKTEIDRIGETTTFNGIPLFRDLTGREHFATENITNFLASPSTEAGYLTESFAYGGGFFPAGTIDFSLIDSTNIELMEGQGFKFTCSQSCAETFEFKMSFGPDKLEGLNVANHVYTVNISGCKDGKEIVDRIYDLVSKNIPTYKPQTSINKAPGAINVSHSNYLLKSADGNKLIVYANNYKKATAKEAETFYPRRPGEQYGAISCTDVVVELGREGAYNRFHIQCSSEVEDSENIFTQEMNTETLGMKKLSVLTEKQATRAITTAAAALGKVLAQRSELGAYQNRLEHAMAINENTAENTDAAESRIRDADMAEETVKYSKYNILSQVGQSMLAQANRINNDALALLE